MRSAKQDAEPERSPHRAPYAKSSDYDRIAAAIAYIRANARGQPELAEVAAAVGLSPSHFHHLFRRWAGTTPKRFLSLLTLEAAKRRLEASRTVLEAAFDAGLSGTGRLHDLFIAVDAITPGEYRSGGVGVEIRWGEAETPFGVALVGHTGRGLCHLSFHDATDPAPSGARAADLLGAEWPAASLRRDDALAIRTADAIFAGDPTPLHVSGTNFQLRVWQALLRIPSGAVASYEDVARGIGRPSATRAVAGAVARNRIGWLIPCHRVIRKAGETGGYRWGEERKVAMLAWEAVRR